MRNRFSLVIFLLGALLFSLPAAAQVYYSGGRSEAQKKAADESKTSLKYDPHDLSGVWSGVAADRRGGPRGVLRSTLMGGTPPPPMTVWGQEQFDAHKPSKNEAPASRKVRPALSNDPQAKCDPLGYPRNLLDGEVEFVETPGKILQVFGIGRRIREIFMDGRQIPDDLDPTWYGWAVGHWEGDALIVDSKGYDDRSWLDGVGYPHSDEMKLHEVYRHPDALTLEITMTLEDPKAYAKPWGGATQTFKLQLPKGLTVLYEWYCVPSEEEAFNEGVRNPADGVVGKK
jgi:hypothetical protein